MTNERNKPRQQRPSRIPDFSTREDEAAFWDTHDLDELLAETRPVRPRVGKGLSEGLTVRLDQKDREKLERRALAQGIGASTLVRLWIKERLRGTERFA